MNKSEIIIADIHSHILPGVDDGISKNEAALEAVKHAAELGVRYLILTPHFSVRREYTVSKDRIIEVFGRFSEECVAAGIRTELFLGNEVDYSQDVTSLLRKGKLLPLAGSEYLLTEFYPGISEKDIHSAVRDILRMGYTPVLAHIERYPEIVCKPDCIKALKESGALIQMNLDSLIGREKNFCKKILKKKFVDFIGTDTHRKYISEDELNSCIKIITKFCDAAYTNAILYGNAFKYIIKNNT